MPRLAPSSRRRRHCCRAATLQPACVPPACCWPDSLSSLPKDLSSLATWWKINSRAPRCNCAPRNWLVLMMLFILACLLAFQISPESYACSHGCDFKGTSYLGVHWNYFFCHNLSPFISYLNFSLSTIMISRRNKCCFLLLCVFFHSSKQFLRRFLWKRGVPKKFCKCWHRGVLQYFRL